MGCGRAVEDCALFVRTLGSPLGTVWLCGRHCCGPREAVGVGTCCPVERVGPPRSRVNAIYLRSFLSTNKLVSSTAFCDLLLRDLLFCDLLFCDLLLFDLLL